MFEQKNNKHCIIFYSCSCKFSRKVLSTYTWVNVFFDYGNNRISLPICFEWNIVLNRQHYFFMFDILIIVGGYTKIEQINSTKYIYMPMNWIFQKKVKKMLVIMIINHTVIFERYFPNRKQLLALVCYICVCEKTCKYY